MYLKKMFTPLLCTYFAILCLAPSNVEIIGAITLFLITILVFKNNELIFFKDPILFSILAFGAYSSTVNALGPGEISRTGIIYGWAIPLLVGKAFALFRATTIHKDMLICAIALALFLLGAQILLVLKVHSLGDFNLNLHSLELTFRNPTRTAIFAAVAALICITHITSGTSIRQLIMVISSCASLMTALVLSGKRMTLAALLACAGIVMIARKQYRFICIIILTTACLIFAVGQTQRFNLSPAHLLTSQGAIERFTVWHAAIEIFKEHPFTGSGFRTFQQAATEHVANYRATHTQLQQYENLNDAHNLFLQLLSENGIIGTAIFSLIFFFPLRNCWRLRRTNPAAIPLLSCIALILLNSQLHVHIFSLNVSGLLFFLTGAANGIGEEHNR
jgi:O-antigen ligase